MPTRKRQICDDLLGTKVCQISRTIATNEAIRFIARFVHKSRIRISGAETEVVPLFLQLMETLKTNYAEKLLSGNISLKINLTSITPLLEVLAHIAGENLSAVRLHLVEIGPKLGDWTLGPNDNLELLLKLASKIKIADRPYTKFTHHEHTMPEKEDQFQKYYELPSITEELFISRC